MYSPGRVSLSLSLSFSLCVSARSPLSSDVSFECYSRERGGRGSGCHAGGAIRIRQCVRRDRDRARFSRTCNYYLYLGESGASLLKPIKKGREEGGGGRGEQREKEKGLFDGFLLTRNNVVGYCTLSKAYLPLCTCNTVGEI